MLNQTAPIDGIEIRIVRKGGEQKRGKIKKPFGLSNVLGCSEEKRRKGGRGCLEADLRKIGVSKTGGREQVRRVFACPW